MYLRCIKILLLSLVVQSIVAQQPGLISNGCQNLPAPEITQNYNQPVASYFPGSINNPLTLPYNLQKAQALQTALPKLQSINTQIGELLNLVSNINNRQLMGSSLVQNTLTNQPVPTLQQNNPYLPYSCNNINNVPNNNYVSTASNLPEYNIQFNNLPVNMPVHNPLKINSLTLSGKPFNHGQPFSVLPDPTIYGHLNIASNNFMNYNDIERSSLKIPRSLSVNDVENGYLTSNSVENIPPTSWPNYDANIVSNIPLNNFGNGIDNNLVINQQIPYYGQTSNEVQTNYVANNVPITNYISNPECSNLPANQAQYTTNGNEVQGNIMTNTPQNSYTCVNTGINTALPTNYPVPNFPTGTIASNNVYTANTPLNNVDYTKNINSQYVEQIKNIPGNEWQQLIQNYQNSDLSLTNWLGSLSQPVGTNLPELINTRSLGEFSGLPVGTNLPEYTHTRSLGEYSGLPIFSGLPIIGITETVSLINPEINQTPLVVL